MRHYIVKERITKINTEPLKTNSSYGNWVVYADAHFNNGSKEWDYPNKSYFFFTKKRALEFIEEANHAINNGRLATV